MNKTQSQVRWEELTDTLIEEFKDNPLLLTQKMNWIEAFALTIYDFIICHLILKCKLPQRVYSDPKRLKKYLNGKVIDPDLFIQDSNYRQARLLSLESEINAHKYNVGHSMFSAFDSTKQLHMKLRIKEVISKIDDPINKEQRVLQKLDESEIEQIARIVEEENLISKNQTTTLKFFLDINEALVKNSSIEIQKGGNQKMALIFYTIDEILYKVNSKISYMEIAKSSEIFISSNQSKRMTRRNWVDALSEAKKQLKADNPDFLKLEDKIQKVFEK